MRAFSLVLAFAAAPLFAQIREAAPDNFPVSPCAVANSCQTFDDSELVSAAFSYYGLQLDMNWITANRDVLLKAFEPACRRHATCLATPGTTYWFCDDVLTNELHEADFCAKLFPQEAQPKCRQYREIWLLGIDIKAKDKWQAAQKCAASTPPVQHTKPLEVWMRPEVLPPHFKGKVTLYARDADTHLPVYAKFKFDTAIVYASANPEGLPATVYPFDYTPTFKRVPNAEGHTDLVPPTVTVTAPYYPTSSFPLKAEVPKAIVELKREGRNKIIVEAKDATTGKPVEMRVMMGDDAIGDTNKPIELKRGQKGQIWVTSLFNMYSDQVVK
jgi:hypothetical protein